jgi:hypothetical protein
LDQTTISKRRKALTTLPTKLETAFQSTISRIKNQKSERSNQAFEVLKWTFLAQRPLTVIELCHALSVTIDPGKMQPGKMPLTYNDTLDWENFPSQKSLIDWCLGLVIVGVRPRSRSLEPLAPALPLVVPGLGLGLVLVLILA